MPTLHTLACQKPLARWQRFNLMITEKFYSFIDICQVLLLITFSLALTPWFKIIGYRRNREEKRRQKLLNQKLAREQALRERKLAEAPEQRTAKILTSGVIFWRLDTSEVLAKDPRDPEKVDWRTETATVDEFLLGCSKNFGFDLDLVETMVKAMKISSDRKELLVQDNFNPRIALEIASCFDREIWFLNVNKNNDEWDVFTAHPCPDEFWQNLYQ